MEKLKANFPDGKQPYFIRGLIRSRAFPGRQILFAWKIEYQPHTDDWKTFYWSEIGERWAQSHRAHMHPESAIRAVATGQTGSPLWDEATSHADHDEALYAQDLWDRVVLESYREP